MALISSYPLQTPQLGDQILGSNTIDSAGNAILGNPTVQYTLESVKSLVNQNYVHQVQSSSALTSQASALNTVYSIRFGQPEALDTSKNVQLLVGTGAASEGDKIIFNQLGTYQIILEYNVGVTQSAANIPLLVFRTLQDGTTQVGSTKVFNQQFTGTNRPLPLIIPITTQIITAGTFFNFQIARSGVNDGGLINLASQGGINGGITPTFTPAASASITISKLM